MRIKDVNDETQSNIVDMEFYELRRFSVVSTHFGRLPRLIHTLYLPLALPDLADSASKRFLRLDHIWEDFHSTYVKVLKYKAEQ